MFNNKNKQNLDLYDDDYKKTKTLYDDFQN